MAQVNWIYLDDCGGRHSVGVYHGDRSGHLMIHCNRRVVQIDFSVRSPKTYSFFIEDEFCEVIIDKMPNGRFGYEFRVNKTIDTPRNRIRRIDNQRNNKKLAALIIGVVLFLTLVFFSLKWYGLQQEAKSNAKTSILHNVSKANIKQLAATGRSSTSVLHLEEINAKRVGVYTFKLADSSEVRGVFDVSDNGQVLLPNGFPLQAGDAFETIYLPADPQVHRIELYRPTHATISRYIQTAFVTEHRLHPNESKEKCLCRVLTIAESQNWRALADIIFQESSPELNPRHNQDSYLRLIRNPELLQKMEQGCWDK